jgi:hypothetical protein
VYWEGDPRAALLAHKTGDVWTLTRLNLRRFGENLIVGERLSDEEIKEIAEHINTAV